MSEAEGSTTIRQVLISFILLQNGSTPSGAR